IKLIEEEKSKVYIFKKENKKVAYFITMEVDKFILITHLAVIKEFRGKGLGKEFLKNIEEFFYDKNLLIVEVESEKMSTNKEELDTINRKKNFYLKSEYIKYSKIDYR